MSQIIRGNIFEKWFVCCRDIFSIILIKHNRKINVRRIFTSVMCTKLFKNYVTVSYLLFV